MHGHFRAFSFVDRLTLLENGSRVQGQYAIPPGVGCFPASLVTEAVGQLAAWAAMAQLDCSHRPVAGIAGRIELLADVYPGQVLDLAADLESVDTETAGYSGVALVDGTAVLRLWDCVGPMVPAEEFDEVQSLRERLQVLRTVGVPAGAFEGLPGLDLTPDGGEPGQSARAILRVPTAASFFSDHFPRRPVLPGTLLMHANLQTAATLVAQLSAGCATGWKPRIVSEVKLRTFINPGETVKLEAKRIDHSDSRLTVGVESRLNHRLVGSATIAFSPAPTS